MRKVLIVLLVTLGACMPPVVQGGSRGVELRFPDFRQRVEVTIVNDCYESTVYVKTPDGAEHAVEWGNDITLSVSRSFLHDDRLLLTARGRGTEGVYLGSASVTFNARPEITSEEWQIDHLRNGERSCRPPRRRV